MYRCKYLDGAGLEHWRTLSADSLNHAMKVAKRIARKGWIIAAVTPYWQ